MKTAKEILSSAKDTYDERICVVVDNLDAAKKLHSELSKETKDTPGILRVSTTANYILCNGTSIKVVWPGVMFVKQKFDEVIINTVKKDKDARWWKAVETIK